MILRTCTRVAHAQSAVELGERADIPLKDYVKNAPKFVAAPANAVKRHVVVEERMRALAQFAETTSLNREEMGDTEVGFVTSGTCYLYVREVFPNASVFKLGLVNPLPVDSLRAFAGKVKKLIVVEELDGVIEAHLRAHGIRVDGGKDLFGLLGELSQGKLRAAMGVPQPESAPYDEMVPARPPVMCPGCPHRGLFAVLSKLKLTVMGDIGCYTLGASAPLAAMDTTVCMGASIGMAHGFTKMRPDAAKRTVAIIGDSTFMHSGMTGVVNVAYNKGVSTVIVLDNANHRHDRSPAEPDHGPDAAPGADSRHSHRGCLPRGGHRARARGRSAGHARRGSGASGRARRRCAVGHHRAPPLHAAQVRQAEPAARRRCGEVRRLQVVLAHRLSRHQFPRRQGVGG